MAQTIGYTAAFVLLAFGLIMALGPLILDGEPDRLPMGNLDRAAPAGGGLAGKADPHSPLVDDQLMLAASRLGQPFVVIADHDGRRSVVGCAQVLATANAIAAEEANAKIYTVPPLGGWREVDHG